LQNRRTPSPSVFDSYFKRKGSAEEVHERDEPHRGSAFDSPGLPNDSAGYPGLIRSMEHNAIGVALFLISSLSKGGAAQRMFAN